MANWQKAFGEASTGAGIGSALLPGIGTAIGGGIGLLAGFFDSDDPKPQIPDDPNRGAENALIQKLSSDKLSDTAANAQNKARRSFLDTMDSYKNTPGAGRNASVLSKLGVKANDALGENLVDIDTADASQRLSRQTQAGAMLSSQRNNDMQRDMANINLQQKPSVLESIGQFAASGLAGGIVGALNQKSGGDLAKTTPKEEPDMTPSPSHESNFPNRFDDVTGIDPSTGGIDFGLSPAAQYDKGYSDDWTPRYQPRSKNLVDPEQYGLYGKERNWLYN